VDLFDVEAGERVEAELEHFIEKRSRDRTKENALEEAWVASERRHLQKRREENAALWCSFHLSQAERLEGTAAVLAASHRQRAAELGGGAMPQADLSALFDTMQTFEEAKALADAVGSERELLRELHPNAAFPGHGTWAIIGTLATAAMGLRSVAKREAARIQAEAEEAARPLEMAAGVL